jgi:hypothetical protein
MFPGITALPPRASAPAEEFEIKEEETPMHEEMEAAAVDISPESVCYRDETQKCGNCAYMEESGECQPLKMTVDAEAGCNLFKEREG